MTVTKLAAAAAAIILSASSYGATVTFDEAAITPIPPATVGLIPNGYAGLNWTNFWVLNTDIYFFQSSGYVNGMVSPDNVAFNGDANPATVSVSDGLFTFNSAYLTAAWNDGLNIAIEGFAGAALLHSQTVVVDTTGPTLFTFDWAGIDSLTFTSSGGTSAGLGGAGAHFAMDNFTFNEAAGVVVPLPAAGWAGLALLGMLSGTGAWRRNRQLAA